MAKQLRLNSDKTRVREVLTGNEVLDGFCACQVLRDDDSLCPFSFDYLPDTLSSELLCGFGAKNAVCVCKLYV